MLIQFTGANRQRLDQVRTANSAFNVLENEAADPAAADALAAEAKRLFGTIDAAFLNAGVGAGAPLGHLTPEIYRSLMDINVGGPCSVPRRWHR